MKTRLLMSISIFFLTSMINNGCATTPEKLHQSAKKGKYNQVEKLIDAGVDVNSPDENGDTALISASQNGYTEIVKLLVEAEADVNAQDNVGNTALIKASQNGFTEIVKLLIEADVNAQDNVGDTALILASRWEDLPILLIEAGADVNAMTKFEVRSINYSGIHKDYEPTGGYTALMAASEYGHTEIVKLLIEAGTDVNARHWDDATAFDFALEAGNTEIAKLLIEVGANAQNKEGHTVLMKASEEGHIEVVK